MSVKGWHGMQKAFTVHPKASGKICESRQSYMLTASYTEGSKCAGLLVWRGSICRASGYCVPEYGLARQGQFAFAPWLFWRLCNSPFWCGLCYHTS